MKGNSAPCAHGRPGGSLTSKPTWSNTSRFSATSVFFVLKGAERQPMKEGLCEAVARGKSIVGGKGSPSAGHPVRRVAEEPAEFVLDTSIDLAGNPCRWRLTIDDRQLTVDNLAGKPAGNRRREPAAVVLGGNRGLPRGTGRRLAFPAGASRWAVDRRPPPARRRDAGIVRSGGPPQCTRGQRSASRSEVGDQRDVRPLTSDLDLPTSDLRSLTSARKRTLLRGCE